MGRRRDVFLARTIVARWLDAHGHAELLGHGPVRLGAPDPGRGGLGLHLVDTLASRWGVDREDGTRVWFELAACRNGT